MLTGCLGHALIMTTEEQAQSGSGTSTQALQELTPATASIGEWFVKVYRDAQVIPYSYTYRGETKHAKKTEVLLLGQESEEYCIGRARKGNTAKDESALAALAARFKDGTLWKMSKVSLISENKAHLGSSVKVVVDLAKTTFTPVLQSSVPMPVAPAPVELLSGILAVKATQRCDVTCLLKNVGDDPKTVTTTQGERKLVDVSICDDSEDNGIAAKLSFGLWFSTGDEGKRQIDLLKDAFQRQVPISMFGLYVQPEPQQDESKVSCKASKEFWWIECPQTQTTEKVQKLRSDAGSILARETKELAASDGWTPPEAVNYAACDATRLNVQLLQAIVQREKDALPTADEGGHVIFQLNCVRLVEPAPGDDLTTKDNSRLFVPVRVMDDWGQMTLRMRESTALQASNMETKEAFVEAVQKGGLQFPLLSSIRVRVKRGSASANASSQDDPLIDAIIVEVEQQSIEEACRPNSALMAVAQASKPLGGSTACMVVGRLSQVKRAPHAGLTVDGTCCEFALVLCLVKAKSEMQKIGQGFRIVTGGLHEVTTTTKDGKTHLEEASVKGTFVSMCTLENCPQFNLTPSNLKHGMYRLALISSVNETKGGITYIVDRVSGVLEADERLSHAMLLDEMAKLTKIAKPDERPKRSASWASETSTTLTAAKKTRALSREPTNTPLPELQNSVA